MNFIFQWGYTELVVTRKLTNSPNYVPETSLIKKIVLELRFQIEFN